LCLIGVFPSRWLPRPQPEEPGQIVCNQYAPGPGQIGETHSATTRRGECSRSYASAAHFFCDNHHGATTLCRRLGFAAGTATRDRSAVFTKPAMPVGACNSEEALDSCSGGGNAWANFNFNGGWCNVGHDNIGVIITCTGGSETAPPSCAAAPTTGAPTTASPTTAAPTRSPATAIPTMRDGSICWTEHALTYSRAWASSDTIAAGTIFSLEDAKEACMGLNTGDAPCVAVTCWPTGHQNVDKCTLRAGALHTSGWGEVTYTHAVCADGATAARRAHVVASLMNVTQPVA